MSSRRPLVAGNWKMNGVRQSRAELDALTSALRDRPATDCDIMLIPPFTLLMSFSDVAAGGPVMIGAQDCSPQPEGPHTGDISAGMLKDAGVVAVIAGHSERRANHRETDGVVRAKAEAIHAAGLVAIVCIGETEPERDRGDTLSIVTSQVHGSVPDSANATNTIIAYEPVWAIGTGRTPTPDDVAIVHAAIRAALCDRFGKAAGESFRLLYGGSVKPSNASQLMAVANVDGALVGGASLRSADFDGIIDAFR